MNFLLWAGAAVVGIYFAFHDKRKGAKEKQAKEEPAGSQDAAPH